MDLETKRIEKMLKEGKITREEAITLLGALPQYGKKLRKPTTVALLHIIEICCVVAILILELVMTFSGRRSAAGERPASEAVRKESSP